MIVDFDNIFIVIEENSSISYSNDINGDNISSKSDRSKSDSSKVIVKMPHLAKRPALELDASLVQDNMPVEVAPNLYIGTITTTITTTTTIIIIINNIRIIAFRI